MKRALQNVAGYVCMTLFSLFAGGVVYCWLQGA